MLYLRILTCNCTTGNILIYFSASSIANLLISFATHSCSLQPEPEWHRPPDVPRGRDITAGGRGGVGGRWGCAAGRRQSELPGHQPSHVPAPIAATPLRLWVWTDTGKSWSERTQCYIQKSMEIHVYQCNPHFETVCIREEICSKWIYWLMLHRNPLSCGK